MIENLFLEGNAVSYHSLLAFPRKGCIFPEKRVISDEQYNFTPLKTRNS